MGNARHAMWALVVGSVVAMVGVFMPATSDFFDSDFTDADLIVLVDDDRPRYLVAFGLMGLGTAIAGVGLFMLGRAITPMEREMAAWRGTAAQVASFGGLLAALAGLERLLVALFATPEFFVDEGMFGDIVYVIGMVLGLTLSMILIGVLAWAAPPPKWTAVVLIVAAVLGLPAFMPWFVGLIVFAVANLVVMARRPEPVAV
jgi:MFS family permease